MRERNFEVPLDDTELEWIRYRFTTEGRLVVTFLVQYETFEAGERKPIVRYDNAHGFAHRDRLNRRGDSIDKQVLPEHLTANDVLELGRQDIQRNWQRYSEQFFGDEP